ncbi:hypothetical protein SAMN04488012_108148 [Palleronia salina]|uniref:Uncharacterized protein n=1 Tax=Palleronia salina TaxID=313368 RepID=A0A1M6IXP9_9RHOB|nr:hypothetical protein [Palleronia salina]SHJ39197.1 hypothetical protein SAMN04488012_108148 [Palleronia salina]
MIHMTALFSSVAALVLAFAIYARTHPLRHSGWLRGEILFSILLAMLVGLFPMALITPLIGVWEIVTGVISAASTISVAADLVALVCAFAAVLVFRAAVRDAFRQGVQPTVLQR